jgi:flagellar biosynthesis protein FlhB
MSDLDRRTHKPTPKRVAEFRKRGEIARSRDLMQASSMAGGAFLGLLFAKSSLGEIEGLVRDALSSLGVFAGERSDPWLVRAGSSFAIATLPVVLGGLLGYLASASLQLGFPPAFARLTPDFFRPFSIRGIENLFAPKAAAKRLVLSIAKLAFVGLAASLAAMHDYERYLAAPPIGAGAIIERILDTTVRLACYACGALLLLGVAEYAFEKRELNARMRMTPEEIKREMKDQEGDPAIRRKRRQRMRDIAKHRMSAAVKSADVVIVNPTEYAVAIRYRTGEDRAPRVVAKGRRHVAGRIRELARKAGVPILPEPPLARLLYKIVPEGREIPVNVYQAVAEVLAYVYRLKRRGR